LDLPLGGVDWLPEADKVHGSWDEGGVAEFSAAARGLRMGGPDDDFELFYDTPSMEIELKSLKCVVVGKRKMIPDAPEDKTTHYVLLIANEIEKSSRGRKVYERVGVGYMAGEFIDWVESEPDMLVSVQ